MSGLVGRAKGGRARLAAFGLGRAVVRVLFGAFKAVVVGGGDDARVAAGVHGRARRGRGGGVDVRLRAAAAGEQRLAGVAGGDVADDEEKEGEREGAEQRAPRGEKVVERDRVDKDKGFGEGDAQEGDGAPQGADEAKAAGKGDEKGKHHVRHHLKMGHERGGSTRG